MSMWWASVLSAVPGICFACFAIRSSFVETLSGSGVPFIFPPTDCAYRQPLPSTGSFGRLPPLLRYYELLRLPSSIPLASFVLRLRGTAQLSLCGDRRISQGPGEPSEPAPCSTTPAGPSCLALKPTSVWVVAVYRRSGCLITFRRRSRHVGVVHHRAKRKPPTINCLSRLNHTAH